ncbi:M48 family metalloprotease [Natrinema limicola]|uniref:Peptidase M48 Ste24p n=1 Tax=Natrinema limicola JCM 13563 TaxID=1230457 RepID=M0CPS9_9EURY|nr:M48 family metalloprotease [Natrinema limicola]ELZ25270.1 peptidase M48 Ste24p [Natrinema limicola JCM 13563]
MLGVAAFVFVLAIGPFFGLRAYARRVEAMNSPIEDRLHRLNRVQQAAGFGLPALALLGVYAFGLLDRATAPVETAGPDLFGVAVLEFAVRVLLTFAIVAVPLVSMALGTYPTVRALRETGASAWRRVRRVLTVLTIAIAIAVVGIGAFLALGSAVSVSRLGLVVTLCILVVAGFGLSPYLLVLTRDHVPLEGQRRERIERLCAKAGYSPQGISLLEGESTKTANALVAGSLPGRRYVFLTDHLLAACDDDELQAILAHEFGHVAGRHLWQRGALTGAVVGVWALIAPQFGSGWFESTFSVVGLLMGLYVLYRVVLLGALARWQEFQADAYAARTVGREATIAALETLADANDVRLEAGFLYSLATHHPPIADRIAALRNGVDGERSRTPSSD